MIDAWEELQPVANAVIPRALEKGLDSLTPIERNVFLVWSYPGMVNNGGHASFILEGSGEFAEETVEALIETGSPEYADILQRTIDQFPRRAVPRDYHRRSKAWEALPKSAYDAVAKCDDEFFALGGDRLAERLLMYWKGHAARDQL